jgi:hypothetical protein
MSGVIIAGNTSGSVTLDAPAVSGSTVITLPTTSGTMATLTTPSFTTTIGVGAATPSASGAGITFPNTQSASTDANTLDDYEEGTWTPTVTSSTGSITAYTSSGNYVKVGKLVTITGSAIITTVGTAGGALVSSSIPFTTQNIALTWYGAGSEVQATGTPTHVYTTQNVNTITTVSTSGGALTWASGRTFNFSITYMTT